MDNKVINISKKTFINVLIILFSLIIVSIGITYIVPKGTFEVINIDGEITFNYSKYIPLENESGINIFKGLFAPILILGSSDGLSIIMLCIFLSVISGAFQIINDTNGIKAIVKSLIEKFKENKKLLISLIILIFMCFGSFLGLFEEVLTLLPLIIALTISLNYDSFTAFIICIVATGFGFASALTNPFTVITASNIIGISPLSKVWLRIVVFLLMYGLLLVYTFYHIKKIEKDPSKSPTYEFDNQKRNSLNIQEEIINEKKILKVYIAFFITFMTMIILSTSLEFLRGYTVVVLIVVFLFGGFICGYCCTKDLKAVAKSFYEGVKAALPAIVLVLLASSIKFILEEGKILATIAYSISSIVEGRNIYLVGILIYIIILILEFFISSSTAKAIFVMEILSCVNIGLSKELLVLLYLFGDGYTNVLFPTSPVLLIGLSMIGMSYGKWLKNSKWLFLLNTLLVFAIIIFAILIRY